MTASRNHFALSRDGLSRQMRFHCSEVLLAGNLNILRIAHVGSWKSSTLHALAIKVFPN